MELYNENNKLFAIIDKDYSLLSVIDRLGIKLGFGDKSVKDICEGQNINPDFFIDIVNIFHNANYFPEKRLLDYPINLVTGYLLKTHIYYRDYVLVEIERNLNLISSGNTEENSYFEMLRKFYGTFKNSFIQHLNNEEQLVFPYAERLQDVYQDLISHQSFREQFSEVVISDFKHEHTVMDEKMTDLKSIIIKYLPPVNEQNKINAVLVSLFQFEKDLKYHARIEDKILLAKIKQLEMAVSEKNG